MTAVVLAKGSPRRILIVDDNVALADNIGEILAMAGHLTDIVATAEEALSKVLARTPDVVVTDYRLPGLSGADLIRRLRSGGLRVHAIVISGHTDDKTIEDARSAGAAFVAKPVDFKILGNLIAQVQDA